jgi:formyl-CoA transferase
MQATRFIWADNEGRDVKREMRAGGIAGIHPTKAGELYISANTPHFWQALCDLVGLPQLAADPNYDTVRKRAQRTDEIVAKIREALVTRTALEWEGIFGEQVPCCAVRPIEDMFDHPQVLAEGLVASMEHPVIGRYRGLANPIKFGSGPLPPPSAAPALGQHTSQLLAEYGYSEAEIQKLRESGAVNSSPSTPGYGKV